MKMRRDATWWITYPDLNWPNIDGLDRIKKHAEDLAEANVSTVILFGTHFRTSPSLLLHDVRVS